MRLKSPSLYGLAIFIVLLFAFIPARANLPVVMEENDILPYLEKMIAWHRQAVSLEVSPTLPRELLMRDSLQGHADKALRSSFEFAHALAGITPAAPKAADADAAIQTPPKGKGILKAIATTRQQISDLQSGLSKARTARDRFQFNGKLKLAQEHLTLLQTIAENIDNADEVDNNLDAKITKLGATIPELNSKREKSAALPAAAVPASTSGIFGLMTEVYSSLQVRQDIKVLLANTKEIRAESRDYSHKIVAGVKDILSQGDNLGQNNSKDGPTYDSLLADMKKLTRVAVASSGVGHALDDCSQDLMDWRDLLSRHINDVASRIALRLFALMLALGGVVAISVAIGRTMPRYVPDERRLHQLNSIRKVAGGVAIALIAFLGLFTDLSSLGTFIGLIGAGLAVALQNVILSVIAYFQFFGAFGLKVGDRITISGVTGRVMKIGMLRFYIMEMQESDMGYLPTGRAVGFSNAILFQPMPFFRQTPGTNFVWSEMLLTLGPTADHQEVCRKIQDVVNQVYAKHLDAMKKQQLSLQQLAHFKAEVSVPQIYLKITGGGLVLVIRYAVERDQESVLHLQMTEGLLTAIRKDPALKIVNIG